MHYSKLIDRESTSVFRRIRIISAILRWVYSYLKPVDPSGFVQSHRGQFQLVALFVISGTFKLCFVINGQTSNHLGNHKRSNELKMVQWGSYGQPLLYVIHPVLRCSSGLPSVKLYIPYSHSGCPSPQKCG